MNTQAASKRLFQTHSIEEVHADVTTEVPSPYLPNDTPFFEMIKLKVMKGPEHLPMSYAPYSIRAFIFAESWRNGADSTGEKFFRRVTVGTISFPLVIAAVVEAIARFALFLIVLPFALTADNSEDGGERKNVAANLFVSSLYSLCHVVFITISQFERIYEDTLITSKKQKKIYIIKEPEQVEIKKQ